MFEEAMEIMKRIYYCDKAGRIEPDNVDKVFKALEEGEKYKQMWEELRLSNKYSEAYELQPPITMIELEQKYFPKPKKINWKDRFDELEEEFEEREAELIKEIEYWKFKNFGGRNRDV